MQINPDFREGGYQSHNWIKREKQSEEQTQVRQGTLITCLVTTSLERYANYGYTKTNLRPSHLPRVDETSTVDHDGRNDPLRYLL
jgi:hypothetical protein